MIFVEPSMSQSFSNQINLVAKFVPTKPYEFNVWSVDSMEALITSFAPAFLQTLIGSVETAEKELNEIK
jgi:hypothetical protein